ncbi:MAG: hypothetical protein RIR73_2521, partial [Chloroflexota bacterium]
MCTIGPASHEQEQMEALVQAGMNVCRLNFSHGTHEDHAKLIQNIRAVREKTKEPLTILQDLQGPKIRVGELPAEGVMLEAGKEVIFTTGVATLPKIGVTYPNLHQDVKAGERLLLDDGLLSVKVLRVDGQEVVCEVIDGGKLTSHKGLNLPETKTSISAMSDKDREDVKFGVEQRVDWIALSFVRSAEDIRELRHVINDPAIRVLAKIEKPEAVEHMDEIIAEVDGIMVARGDLGIEMPAEKVPIIQKQLVKKSLAAGKPVIVATQMLDSMIKNPRATRAEISDIANAVIDHTDATMLSGETASGAHPLQAVETMAATIREVEASGFDDLPPEIPSGGSDAVAMTNLAAILAREHKAKAILVATLTGNAARLVSCRRPELPIFAVTADERVKHQLNLSWGVCPFVMPQASNTAELIDHALAYLLEQQLIQKGDDIIVVAGEPLGQSGHINLVENR